jgi:hypothetical protein
MIHNRLTILVFFGITGILTPAFSDTVGFRIFNDCMLLHGTEYVERSRVMKRTMEFIPYDGPGGTNRCWVRIYGQSVLSQGNSPPDCTERAIMSGLSSLLDKNSSQQVQFVQSMTSIIRSSPEEDAVVLDRFLLIHPIIKLNEKKIGQKSCNVDFEVEIANIPLEYLRRSVEDGKPLEDNITDYRTGTDKILLPVASMRKSIQKHFSQLRGLIENIVGQ